MQVVEGSLLDSGEILIALNSNLLLLLLLRLLWTLLDDTVHSQRAYTSRVGVQLRRLLHNCLLVHRLLLALVQGPLVMMGHLVLAGGFIHDSLIDVETIVHAHGPTDGGATQQVKIYARGLK